GTLSFLRSDGLSHLRLQKLLDDSAHQRTKKIPFLSNHRFDLLGSFVSSLLGHGSILSSVVFHSQLLTMTSSFCGTFRTLPRRPHAAPCRERRGSQVVLQYC